VLTSRPTQKAIIIGKGGALLKEIGSRARRDLEQFFTRRVFLELHVKVEEGWETNRAVLEDVGL
jgi:GTP-binding protein Era